LKWEGGCLPRLASQGGKHGREPERDHTSGDKIRKVLKKGKGFRKPFKEESNKFAHPPKWSLISLGRERWGGARRVWRKTDVFN